MKEKITGRVLSAMLSALCFLSAMLLALSLPVEAQQPEKVRRIGFVSAGSPPGSIRIEPFRQGLRELG